MGIVEQGDIEEEVERGSTGVERTEEGRIELGLVVELGWTPQ